VDRILSSGPIAQQRNSDGPHRRPMAFEQQPQGRHITTLRSLNQLGVT
jgi:hypothetical protein